MQATSQPFIFYFETGSYCVAMLALNSQSSCLSMLVSPKFPSAPQMSVKNFKLFSAGWPDFFLRFPLMSSSTHYLHTLRYTPLVKAVGKQGSGQRSGCQHCLSVHSFPVQIIHSLSPIKPPSDIF
jgi:hypothetical protein